jgi:membrane protein DedA with SNARE-associated domain
MRDGFLEKGKVFFENHGGKSVFLGRFMGPLRPIIPFVAGAMHMRVRRFLFWNITSAFFWSIFYLYLGYFFGEVWASVEKWTGRISLGLIAIFLIAVAIHFYYKYRGKVPNIDKNPEA